MRLTKQQAIELFNLELTRARQLVPHNWAHKFTELKWSKTKTHFGYATSTGVILMSETFIGSDQQDKFIDTVRHELAHLIAGIDAGHNRTWMYYASELGAKPTRKDKAQGTQHEAMKEKYKLIAHTKCGNKVSCGTSHVRMSRYLQYKLGNTKVISRLTSGKEVLYFTYELNK